MPKLVRLTTEDNGIFDCSFNEDFILEPYSSVALHSFTTQFPYTEIVIDSTNNEIYYTMDGEANVKTIVLENGVYNNANIQLLFESATLVLNRSVGFSLNQLAKQWFVGMNGGRVTFQLKRGRIGITGGNPNPTSTRFSINRNVELVASNPNEFQRSAGTILTDDAFIYWKIPASKSSSTFRTPIVADETPNNGGFVHGYLRTCPNSTTTVIDTNDIAYGIRFVNANVPYRYIINGIETVAAGIMPELDDTVVIDIFEDEARFRIYRADNAIDEFYTFLYNHETDLFPVVIYVGDTILGTSQYSNDPFYNLQEDEDEIQDDLGFPIFRPTKTNNYLQFASAELSYLLGFDNPRIPSSGYIFGVNINYEANKAFRLRDYSETYVIELLNINLDSMDAMSKQRRNFLAVIPQIDQIREHVVYVAPNLIFLDLNNQYRQNYRQIRARILKDDLTPVTTYGLSQMTIIVQNGKL